MDTSTLAALAGYIGLALSVGGYLCKDDKKLIGIQALSSFAWGSNALLLGAMTHAALSALLLGLGAYRAVELYRGKAFGANPDLIFAGTILAWAGLTATTWAGINSVPAAAGIFFLLLSNYRVRGHALRLCLYAGALSMLGQAYLFSILPLAISCGLSLAAIAYGHWNYVLEQRRNLTLKSA